MLSKREAEYLDYLLEAHGIDSAYFKDGVLYIEDERDLDTAREFVKTRLDILGVRFVECDEVEFI